MNDKSDKRSRLDQLGIEGEPHNQCSCGECPKPGELRLPLESRRAKDQPYSEFFNGPVMAQLAEIGHGAGSGLMAAAKKAAEILASIYHAVYHTSLSQMCASYDGREGGHEELHQKALAKAKELRGHPQLPKEFAEEDLHITAARAVANEVAHDLAQTLSAEAGLLFLSEVTGVPLKEVMLQVSHASDMLDKLGEIMGQGRGNKPEIELPEGWDKDLDGGSLPNS